MHCSTCGEVLEPGRERCAACGAAVVGYPGSVALRAALAVKRCPRCDYYGEGISYFNRPGHIGLLVGVSFFTSGLGGLVYWLARRKHRICPNCGLGWYHATPMPRVPAPQEWEGVSPWAGDEALPASGSSRRVLGTILILVASFLVMMGLLNLEVAMVAVGSVIGAGGSGTFFWGWRALQERRQALVRALERRVLGLASVRGGTLTVTEVAAQLSVSIPVAEKILVGMDDGFRVRSDITDEGILLYEFPEVQHRHRLREGDRPT